jgi:hypothetical protein
MILMEECEKRKDVLRAIQSLKLVSYITVERKILQIDEGGASKLKSGKLRNIMIVSLLNMHVPKF